MYVALQLTTPKDSAPCYNFRMQVSHQADSKALKAITRTAGGGKKVKNGSKPTMSNIVVDTRGTHKISAKEMKKA